MWEILPPLAVRSFGLLDQIDIHNLIHVQPPHWAIYPLWQKGRARHGQSIVQLQCSLRQRRLAAEIDEERVLVL
jgi:hypothetical protein